MFPQNSGCDKIKGGSIYFRDTFTPLTMFLPVSSLCDVKVLCKDVPRKSRHFDILSSFFLRQESHAKISSSDLALGGLGINRTRFNVLTIVLIQKCVCVCVCHFASSDVAGGSS